jgi:hypothetical protein
MPSLADSIRLSAPLAYANPAARNMNANDKKQFTLLRARFSVRVQVQAG